MSAERRDSKLCLLKTLGMQRIVFQTEARHRAFCFCWFYNASVASVGLVMFGIIVVLIDLIFFLFLVMFLL